jgi:hypothetical protein
MRKALRAVRGRPVLAMVFVSAEGGDRLCTPIGEWEQHAPGKFRALREVVEMPREPAVAQEMAALWSRRCGAVLGWYTDNPAKQRLYRWVDSGDAPHMEAL